MLETLGFGAFGAFGALHIACAESARAEVFLDDSLRLYALREASKLSVHVENPQSGTRR